ncbi:MAG: alkaline phosphatase family protein [Candidatus Coatesbacteria bacterium]|nr:alkaline phosphatase family protein [Candidatus Coatesbacteria bacterium]
MTRKRFEINRRDFLKLSACGLLSTGMIGCRLQSRSIRTGRRILILGIDGMDPGFLKKMFNEGLMKNFYTLSKTGSFSPLRTVMPPQSPVAWASFASGKNPAKHGIFDFIHRDPNFYTPFLSTSKSISGDINLNLSSWKIPLSAGKVENLNRSDVFWDYLDAHKIAHTIYKIPSNFPPKETRFGKSISGMGTPDLQGTYGLFTLFTNVEFIQDEEAGGGQIIPVAVTNNKVNLSIPGPENPFKNKKITTYSNGTAFLDKEKSLLLLRFGKEEILLKEKEWSRWIEIDFPFAGSMKKISGIVRFYLKSLYPDFQLYVTPVNINPNDPALPIDAPSGYAANLSKDMGLFYTQGMPENTKSLTSGALTDREYLQQALYILDESITHFEHEFKSFKDGLLFFYFSSLDQNTHVLWRALDEHHPAYNIKECLEIKNAIRDLYLSFDVMLGKILSELDKDDIIIICSDHGFASFKYSVNVNSWLHENKYLYFSDGLKSSDNEAFIDVDWPQTRAYAYGLNGLYLNKRNREAQGIVTPNEEKGLLEEIKEKLLALKDPATNKNVFANIYKATEIFKGEFMNESPDIILGFERDYRIAWQSALGKITEWIIRPNKGKWSGDHCIDYNRVPGVFLSNRKLIDANPSLIDIAPTVLNIFNIPVPNDYDGKIIL